MALRNLKTLFRKGKPGLAVLQGIAGPDNGVWIEDAEGNIVFGERENSATSHPIVSGELTLGIVHGPENIARLVQFLVDKENEKKTLGAETLALYREINLIYNFSDKLSNAENPATIGRLALDEAHSIIKADGGVVKLNSTDLPTACFGCDVSEQLLNFIKTRIQNNGNGETRATILNDPGRETGLSQSQVRALIYAPLKIKESIRGFIVLFSNAPVEYTAGDLKLINTIALMAASSIETSLLYERNLDQVKQRQLELQRMNDIATRFVPKQFIQALGHSHVFDVQLGDKAVREVTVFFSDIRSYSTMSERMTLSENFDFVMQYNEAMGPVIDRFGGFVAQYLGDGIMALFPESVDDAVTAAIQMQNIINERNAHTALKVNHINVGMGLHTGHLIMGVIGDPSRMDAAIISDTVNSASRMEGLCKHYGARIVISQSTFNQLSLKDAIAWRCLGKVRVKGKEDILEVFDIYEADLPATKHLKNETRPLFAAALEYYQIGRFDEATSNFAQVLAKHPEDKAAQVYLNKSIQYQSLERLPEMWSGVEDMSYK